MTSPTTATSIRSSARSPTWSTDRRSRAARPARLLDLVPNHTSDAHPWFHERRSAIGTSGATEADGSPPNNWKSVFGGGPRGRSTTSGQYYLHNFLPEQPDLDWWNEDVRAAFDDISRFWFERGIAGFRIDVAHALVKDPELRDGDEYLRMRPEVHEIYARWQEVASEYDPKPVLMGETYMLDLDQLRPYWQHLDLAQNFPFANAESRSPSSDRSSSARWQSCRADRQACWFASNHDHSRMATRWAHGNIDKHKAGLFLLLTLPGTAILYQGDEIGLEDGVVPADRILDLATPSRHYERTPMPWTRDGREWQDPWPPLTDTSRNVEDQEDDPSSILNWTRDLIQRAPEVHRRQLRDARRDERLGLGVPARRQDLRDQHDRRAPPLGRPRAVALAVRLIL